MPPGVSKPKAFIYWCLKFYLLLKLKLRASKCLFLEDRVCFHVCGVLRLLKWCFPCCGLLLLCGPEWGYCTAVISGRLLGSHRQPFQCRITPVASHTPRILLGLQELLDKTGQNSGNSGDLQMKQITFPYSQPDTDSDHISATPLKPYAICNLY